MDSADSLSLVKSYFDKKLDHLKNELMDASSKPEKRRKIEVTECFKHKSNKVQYEFNSNQIDIVEDIIRLLDKGAVNRPKRKAKELLVNLQKRNKLIRIAEKSPGGWATVAEYETDRIASDSEDEKRLRKAEKRALEKKAALTKTNKKYSSSAMSRNPESSSGRHRSAPYNRAKPTDICLGCGRYGHWRTNCPNKNTTYKRQYYR